jgi:integrase
VSHFYYEYCPKGVVSRYALLVFDQNDQPFLPLTDFYHDCVKRISKSSALSYLQCLLPYFSWLNKSSNYQGKRVSWSDQPEVIRVAVEDYLMSEMACKVREKDSFRFVNLTSKSPNTVNRFLSAVKAFYKSLILLKQYPYGNPLIDAQGLMSDYKSHTEGVRVGKPRMPSLAGTEEPLPTRRLTDSFFKLINEEWQPQIIGDPTLPYQVYQAGKKANWSQKEMVIARMLFETGARASEIIELTVGDYRLRKDFQEVGTFNKGSHGRRVKFLRFSKDTVKRLMHYINTERKQYDPDHYGFNDLSDEAPIFLTELGTPLTYEAWYYHWNEAMRKSQLKINPHKARHWFVTSRLHQIYNISKTEAEIEQRKNELIKYMKWKNPDTIKVYEHYFNEEKHREVHDSMLENMEKKELEFITEQKKVRKKKTPLTLVKAEKEVQVDKDLQELLDGLE